MYKLINKFIVAIYIRLSQEDLQEEKNKRNQEDSESVVNQKHILTKYVEEQGYELYKIYIDDGYTGTNFDRPAFKEMIKDIELGRINMVVTKDLSRLGRDYITTGEYIEKWFPSHGVRYVSLLDGVDTYFDNSNNEIAPFKAIINDMYSRDNSKKVRAALHAKQDEGKWVGGCTPLGYKQDPEDKNHLVINEEEAYIVRKIFALASDGKSICQIKDILDKEKIPTAQMIRKRKPVNNALSTQGIWCAKTIFGILSNQLYTGDMVQNRRSRISYKVRKVVNNSKSDWKIVENTHEAYIDKLEFARIQKLITKNGNRATKKIIRCLDGLLFCYECKHRISIDSPRKNGNTYMSCNYYRTNSKLKLCTSHGFNYDNLEKEVLNICRQIFNKYLDKEYLKKELLNKKMNTSGIDNLKTLISKLEIELSKKEENLDKMYMDNLDGKIDSNMYNRLSEKISSDIREIKGKIDLLNKELSEKSDADNDEVEKSCDEVIKEFLKMEKPTKSIMLRLIDRIEIHNDKTVDIYFNFKKLNFLLEYGYHN